MFILFSAVSHKSPHRQQTMSLHIIICPKHTRINIICFLFYYWKWFSLPNIYFILPIAFVTDECTKCQTDYIVWCIIFQQITMVAYSLLIVFCDIWLKDEQHIYDTDISICRLSKCHSSFMKGVMLKLRGKTSLKRLA